MWCHVDRETQLLLAFDTEQEKPLSIECERGPHIFARCHMRLGRNFLRQQKVMNDNLIVEVIVCLACVRHSYTYQLWFHLIMVLYCQCLQQLDVLIPQPRHYCLVDNGELVMWTKDVPKTNLLNCPLLIRTSCYYDDLKLLAVIQNISSIALLTVRQFWEILLFPLAY